MLSKCISSPLFTAAGLILRGQWCTRSGAGSSVTLQNNNASHRALWLFCPPCIPTNPALACAAIEGGVTHCLMDGTVCTRLNCHPNPPTFTHPSNTSLSEGSWVHYQVDNFFIQHIFIKKKISNRWIKLLIQNLYINTSLSEASWVHYQNNPEFLLIHEPPVSH